MTTGRINQGASFSKCSFEQKLVVVVRTTQHQARSPKHAADERERA